MGEKPERCLEKTRRELWVGACAISRNDIYTAPTGTRLKRREWGQIGWMGRANNRTQIRRQGRRQKEAMEEAWHETKAKKHRMFCLGPAHHRLVAATQVSNTNSLLTLNSNALPTESFVTPFADWSGFFKERMPLYLPLPPGHTSSSVALLFKPSAFLFLSSDTLLNFSVPNTHWQVDTGELNAGQTILQGCFARSFRKATFYVCIKIK